MLMIELYMFIFYYKYYRSIPTIVWILCGITHVIHFMSACNDWIDVKTHTAAVTRLAASTGIK